MRRPVGWMMAALTLVAVLLTGCTPGSAPMVTEEAARLEMIDGSEVHRVVLSAAASARLAIETAPVVTENVARVRRVGAQVVAPPEDTRSTPDDFWVRLVLTSGELESADLTGPLAILPTSGTPDDSGLTAAVVPAATIEDLDERAGVLYLSGSRAGHELRRGEPVLVELTLAGSERLVIPYSALVYDAQGRTWVYTVDDELTFVRHPVAVEYIEGDDAILSAGPPPGADVVSVGTAELFGFESGIG